jgi:hypothetical protein
VVEDSVSSGLEVTGKGVGLGEGTTGAIESAAATILVTGEEVGTGTTTGMIAVPAVGGLDVKTMVLVGEVDRAIVTCTTTVPVELTIGTTDSAMTGTDNVLEATGAIAVLVKGVGATTGIIAVFTVLVFEVTGKIMVLVELVDGVKVRIFEVTGKTIVLVELVDGVEV